MMDDRKVLNQLLAAFLIGLTGVVGTLLLLSQGASARPMMQGLASLSVSKSQSADHVQVGAQLAYTLTYQNTSTETVTGVVITDTLDPRVSYVTASPEPTGGLPDTPYWFTGILSESVSGTIVLTVAVTNPLPNGTIITNTATIDGNETEPKSAEITTTVAAPTLGFTKSGDPDPVTSGAPLTYTLTYTNTGDADATGVVITDVLDSRVTYVTASPPPDGGDPHTPHWYIGTLASSTSGEIVISVIVQGELSEDTTLTNTATIDSQQSAPFPVTETTSVRAHSDPVSITLTPATATITAGQSVPYTLTAYDALGNEWIATSSGTCTITPDAGGAWVTHVYTAEKDGTWTVTATYMSRIDTSILTVTNVTPTAAISGPTTGDEGQLLTFDASLSDDPGNDIVSYEWDWAYDTTFSPDVSGITAPHTYPDNGIYTLALRVTDDNGASNIATATITVANVVPTVDAGPDQAVEEAAVVSFTGTFTDPGTDTHDTRWDFGDGASHTGTLAPTHTYTEPGNLTVTLGITDDDGGVGSDVLAVTVENRGPAVDAGGPYTGTAGTLVTLSASGSDPGGGSLTYTWDLDDDGEYDDASGDVVTYTWFEARTHTVTVRVDDAQQAVDTDSAQAFIGPADLSYIALSPSTSTIPVGQAQTYTAEAFDVYSNSRGDVTTQTILSIMESDHGGSWTGNVYTPGNYGDWTVQAVYDSGTLVTTDTASLTVLGLDLHLDKSADLKTVEAGAYLTYTLTYSNTGNQTATGLVITDTLDPYLDYVSASQSPEFDNDDPYWNLDPLGPSDSNQITLCVRVHTPLPNNTILTNTAWIDAIQTVPLSVTHVATVTSRPVLTITKTDFPETVEPKGILRYTLIITNSGNENTTPITITEQYDPNVSFFFSNPDPIDLGSGNRTWVFTTLDVDEPETINIIVHITGTMPVGTVLTNQATLESGQTAPITATETTSVTSAVDFTFYKIDISDPVAAGEELDYVIHYGNHGTSDAYDVIITETYDSRVTFVSADPAPVDGTNNVWEFPEVRVGDVGDIKVTVFVTTPLPNNTLLTNRATIDSRDTSPWTAVETTTVSSAPDLTFSATDDPDPVEPGDPLTYTLRYWNTGNADATGVVVTATLDSNVSYDTAVPTETGGADNVWYWEIDDIPGVSGYGEIVIRTNVTLPLTNGTKLYFEAQLSDAEGDFLEEAARTTITSAPVLSLDKSDGEDTVFAGDRLTYTLTYTNSGNENASNITITDKLPSYVTYIGCETGDGNCQHVSADEVVFHISHLIAKTSGQAQLVVQVKDPLPAGADYVINTARMTHPSLPDPIDAQDVDLIGTYPDLRIAVDHVPTLFSPGKLMTYTVTYGNAGQHMDTEDVIIATTLPTNTTYVGDGWDSSTGQIYTYPVGDLPAGSTGHTITLTVAYPNQPEIGVPEFETPFTIAGSGGTDIDANPDDNSDIVTIGVPDLVVVDFTVEPEPQSLKADVPVTFTVVIENQGTGMAWNPDNLGGFFVDIFTVPIASYPDEDDIECYGTSYHGIEAGHQTKLVITHSVFSEQEILEIEGFWVKVDNYENHPHGLVPESNEMNNVGDPIYLQLCKVYLPLALK